MLRLAIFLLTTTLMVSGSIGSPVGECKAHEDGEPTFLPDSQDCRIFYECSNGVPIKQVCADGMYWDPSRNVCDDPKNVQCENKPMREKQNLKPRTPVGKCPVPQGTHPVYLPDSESCTIFYECDESGNACEKQCPPGTEFNPTLSVCDNPQSAGCQAGKY